MPCLSTLTKAQSYTTKGGKCSNYSTGTMYFKMIKTTNFLVITPNVVIIKLMNLYGNSTVKISAGFSVIFSI
jgi:hypothetical protein